MKKSLHLIPFLACAGSALPAGNEADFLGDWRTKMKPIQPRHYVSGFAAKAPVIDGKIDDEAWKAAAWTEDFVDIEGSAKPKPRYRTRAKMAWDDTYFYIAAEMESPHVWGTLTEHDAVIFQDPDFEVFIDPNSDSQEYFEFEMNALNTGWDLFLPKPYINGGKADNSWEIPGLKTGVHVRGTLNDPSDQDQGWDVEIAIPWQALSQYAHRPIPPNEGDQWRVGFSHVDWQITVENGKYVKLPKTPEFNWIWSAQGIVDMHRPERWGYVQFTRQNPASVSFIPDSSREVRDWLQEVLYAQKDHFSRNKKWANSLTELGLSLPEKGGLSNPSIQETSDGWKCEVKWQSGDSSQTWVIDESGNVRKKEAKSAAAAPWWSEGVSNALALAGENKPQLERALADIQASQREGMAFLIENMPAIDLRSLTASFLLDHVDQAYAGLNAAPWSSRIPKEVFLNDILPYASLNEKRDGGRRKLRELASPIVKECQSPGEAAEKLNRELFPIVNVKYSTQRQRPDQSSIQTLESGKATCTGLSILLVDACRAVGIPARVAGTPMWTNLRGNHTWAEVWDGEWHFTGACEPDKKGLDHGWFVGDASKAKADVRQHAIYASSFKKTGLSFPLIWDESLDWVNAVNVTQRYARSETPSTTEKTQLLVKVLEKQGGRRVAAEVKVSDPSDANLKLEGTSRDETADLNNILPFAVKPHHAYQITVKHGSTVITKALRTQTTAEQTLVLYLDEQQTTPTTQSTQALADLRTWLALDRDQRSAIEGTSFANIPLTKSDAKMAEMALWEDHCKTLKDTQAEAMKAQMIERGDKAMKFEIVRFGNEATPPSDGHSLFISMHGGGGAPPEVNTAQWRNQIKLAQQYKPTEGLYVAPRAPTDTWNLWHEGHIDGLFERLIANLIVFEKVNPNRIYLMGYSAGGDGVYQLAPRLADHFAAASMMAGHPNEASPLGLRNLPFSIQVGANDGAYHRNDVAQEWGKKLNALKAEDPAGYEHFMELPAGKGHWMEMADRQAIPWMEKFTRNPLPEKVVWYQDDVTHDRFYWLAIPAGKAAKGQRITASRNGQNFSLEAQGAHQVTLLLNDALVDLDQPILIASGGKRLFQGLASRSIGILRETLASRGDPKLVFSAKITVTLPEGGKS